MKRERNLQLAVEQARGCDGVDIQVCSGVFLAVLVGTRATASAANTPEIIASIYVVGNTRNISGTQTTRTSAASSKYRREKNVPQIKSGL